MHSLARQRPLPVFDVADDASRPQPSRVRRLRGRRLAFATCLVGATAAALTARSARADEPIKASEPTLMTEPGEVVDIVDAFDEKRDNPFDLHLGVGIAQRWERSKIRRESSIGLKGTADDAGFTHNIENIARYSHSTTTMNFRADVGLYHDLGLYLRLPLILSDTRSLDDLDGSADAVNGKGRASDTATGEPLFKLPFISPRRSGIDYLAAGLRWAILSQQRDPTKPTWTVEIEGRFGIGEPMHACNANPYALTPGAVTAAGGKAAHVDASSTYASCPTPGAIDTDQTYFYRKPGTAQPGQTPQDPGRSPGISRGTNAVRLGSMVSQRFRYVEPYVGFWFMAEFQKRGTDMGDFEGIDGVIVNHPPVQGGFVTGVLIHPYEHREEFQRLTIDLRFNATYVSEGRDYSELFDALGSSPGASLVSPNPSQYVGKTVGGKPISAGDYNRVVNFTGVTDVEAHGIFGGSIGIIAQLNRMFRLNGGVGMTYVQAHLLSVSDACNPDFAPKDGAQGRCQGLSATSTGTVPTITGAPNPNHRPELDLPGRRFRATETILWDVWIHGTVMF